jgi:hypothetical protein
VKVLVISLAFICRYVTAILTGNEIAKEKQGK